MTVQSNYRVFSTPEMLIRTKRITEILDIGGHVRGVAYKGHPLLARIPTKQVEEHTELRKIFINLEDVVLSEAERRQKLLEEMADIMAITELGIRQLKNKVMSTLGPNPAIMRGKWEMALIATTPTDHQFELSKEQVKHFTALLAETRQGLLKWGQRADLNFTWDELQSAMANKSALAGNFDGFAVTKVILPVDSPLVVVFEKHPRWTNDVLSADDIQNSLNHDMINAVTLKR